MKILIIILLQILLLNFEPVYSSAVSFDSQMNGIWINTPGQKKDSVQWTASWIWMDSNKTMMLARKTFNLSEKPEKAILRITASDQYKLLVNGQYVISGPARCAPHHQSYDILDITSLLMMGKNNISVKVHWQKEKQSYQHPGRAGLLAQLNLENEDGSEIICSNNSWKVIPDPSWSTESNYISHFQDTENDRVDLRKYPRNWYGSDYDDSNWENAVELYRTEGWPAPQRNDSPHVLTLPWSQLVARDIAYLSETKVQAVKLMGTYLIDDNLNELTSPIDPINIISQNNKKLLADYSKFSAKNHFYAISGKQNTAQVLIFDFGEVIQGRPILEIEGEKGAIVDIMCAPYMVENIFNHKIIDSDFRDRIILSGDRDQWESTYLKPCRYLAVAIRNTTKSTKLYSCGIRNMEYPFKEQGSVDISEAPWIKTYWKASEKTISVCTTDGYTDNYREKRQYAQTGYYAALGNYWTFGDYALQRRYLIQVAQEQNANGIMPAYAPLAGKDYMIILDSNCLWIRSLYNYLLYSGDYETVTTLIPYAKRLMELLQVYTDKNMLINNPPYPYWLDHANLDRRGANMVLNAHYLGALRDFAQILTWMNMEDSTIYSQLAGKLEFSLKSFWNEEKQLFSDALVDGELSSSFSEHANAMALACGIASKTQSEIVAQTLLKGGTNDYITSSTGLIMVTPAMSYFLHKGLCEYGYIKESFQLFRDRFDKMLAPETNQTLWEEWQIDGTGRTGSFVKKTRSDAQTESAFPPALFAEYIFGIQPAAPGMKRVIIKNIDSGILNKSGTFPSPEGKLMVKWELKEPCSGKLTLDIPGQMEILVDIASLGENRVGEITIDNEVFEPEKTVQYIELKKGTHKISF
jgi:alpha-L-rhamnosidase